MSGCLAEIIRNAIPEWQCGNEKQGKSKVQPAIRDALKASGYSVDWEDGRHFLQAQMPAWQQYSNGAVCYPARRLKIDLVVYDGNGAKPIALVEVESDLANMGSKTGYAVESIARNCGGQPFNSYNSAERMAAAAQYWAMEKASNGRYPSPDEGVKRLQAIRSDSPADHNPTAMSLFLVAHTAKLMHVQLLQPRLDSLQMHLIVGTLDG